MPPQRKHTSFTWVSWASNSLQRNFTTFFSNNLLAYLLKEVVETHISARRGSLFTPAMSLWEELVMPAKGKYLLNNQELKNEALYRKFSCINQYQPLVLLLGLSMLSCGILLILFFALGLVSFHIRALCNNFILYLSPSCLLEPHFNVGVYRFLNQRKTFGYVIVQKKNNNNLCITFNPCLCWTQLWLFLSQSVNLVVTVCL